MKKFLVLALVMGVASLASATLTMVDNGGTIEVLSDIAITTYDVSINVVSGDLQLDGSSVVFNPALVFDFAGKTVTDTPVQYRASASQFFGGPQGPGYLFNNVAYSLNELSVLDLVAYNAAGEGSVVGSLTIVPEPASMALLGLGALLLRRKK